MSTTPVATKPPGESGRMIHGSMNWEPVRQRLLGSDLNDAHQATTELREGIEIVHTTEFPLMLSALLPAFSQILAHRTRPSADTTSIEHKLRNAVLEIISRMPSNEVLRPHAPHLVALAIDILNRDYEDNALLASRIIFDLYKVYRSLPQDYVQPYLDFVQSSYKALPTAVQRNFAFQPPPPPVAATPIVPSASSSTAAAAPTSAPLPAPTTKTASQPQATPAQVVASDKTKEEGTADSKEKETPSVIPSPAHAQSPDSTSTLSPMGGSISGGPKPPMALRSNVSFRVLTEMPLICMLMFQLYPKFLKSNIPVLIQVMMEALSLRAPLIQTLAPPNTKIDSNNKRLYFSRARELVAAQAKTLSFLTYLLRGFSNELKPYTDKLASNVVALMSTCPRESISTRKELLVATRHLLNSDFRNGFFRHVDALLDERVLMGANHRYSEQTVLRPLGYTALSDLIHHVKTLLNMSQMSKVVCMFSRILHDSSTTLPMSTQYTAVRTLLSVVDIIFHNSDPNPQVGRDMLVRILSTLVNKLSTLKDYFPLVMKNEGSKTHDECLELAVSASFGASHLGDDHHHGFLGERGDLRERNSSFDGNIDVSDSSRDLKSMVRAIVVGHKTVIWYINNYRSQREKDKGREKPVSTAGSNEEVSSAMLKMTNSERALVDKYILLAIPCMQFLKEGGSTTASESGASASGEKQTSDQYRDVLSFFAAAFTTLDGYDLKRTLGRRLDILVDAIVDDSAIMVIPRHLLGSNSTTSYEFCVILLDFLVERMAALFMFQSREIRFLGPSLGQNLKELETVNPLVDEAMQAPTEDAERIEKRATTYLQLFERVLKSLSVYPDNEAALRPHIRRIVATCLRSSMENADNWPDNFCMLLRYVFRSISAGKFEESYKELLPLIPTVLNGLYRVIIATDSSLIKNTIIELCLTIPARLSSLLPHMNLLLRVIVQALRSSSGDLVNLG
jgi:transformation/transcription domain-associated protein